MNISVLQELGKVKVTVLRVNGPVTESAGLLEQAKIELDKGSHYLLLDLAHVPYMATAGLRAIHAIYEMLRDAAGESKSLAGTGIAAGTYTSPYLKLFNPNMHVRQALTIAGYDMFLQIFTNYDQALASFE